MMSEVRPDLIEGATEVVGQRTLADDNTAGSIGNADVIGDRTTVVKLRDLLPRHERPGPLEE